MGVNWGGIGVDGELIGGSLGVNWGVDLPYERRDPDTSGSSLAANSWSGHRRIRWKSAPLPAPAPVPCST